MSLRAVAVALAMALLAASCSDGGGSSDGAAIPKSCGLPTPDRDVKGSIVPDAFVLEGAEIAKVARERGGFIASINTPYSVNEAFGKYRRAIKEAGYDLIGEDNEGFEAEVYLREGSKLGAIQIRSSRCEDVTMVFVNIVKRDLQG